METLNEIFAGPWGPVIIFLLRILDVSLGTVRMLLIMRGARLAVPVISFFEVMIWIFAVGNAVRNLNSVWHVFGYAGGFAVGTMAGMWIEDKLAYGFVTVRIISRERQKELAGALRDLGFGLTEFIGQGREGAVEMLLAVVRRRDVSRILREARRRDPDAFITVGDTREVSRGWLFPRRRK